MDLKKRFKNSWAMLVLILFAYNLSAMQASHSADKDILEIQLNNYTSNIIDVKKLIDDPADLPKRYLYLGAISSTAEYGQARVRLSVHELLYADQKELIYLFIPRAAAHLGIILQFQRIDNNTIDVQLGYINFNTQQRGIIKQQIVDAKGKYILVGINFKGNNLNQTELIWAISR